MTTTSGRPDPVTTNLAHHLTDELDDELHILETAWRRPNCTHVCAPLAHSLRCELAHRTAAAEAPATAEAPLP